jgi:hypothetical protein
MTQIKCSFCPKTIEARLWPDEKKKPPGRDLTPGRLIIAG